MPRQGKGQKRLRRPPSQGAADESAGSLGGLLAPELVDELGADAIIVTGGKKGQKRKRWDARGRALEPDEALMEARKVSKRQRKKLEQIQLRKEKEARRADLYKVLEQQRLPPEQQALLRSTKAFAQGKETLKARLARALELQRAGLPITDTEAAELLLKEVERPSLDGLLPLQADTTTATLNGVANPTSAKRPSPHEQHAQPTTQKDQQKQEKKRQARRAAKERMRAKRRRDDEKEQCDSDDASDDDSDEEKGREGSAGGASSLVADSCMAPAEHRQGASLDFSGEGGDEERARMTDGLNGDEEDMESEVDSCSEAGDRGTEDGAAAAQEEGKEDMEEEEEGQGDSDDDDAEEEEGSSDDEPEPCVAAAEDATAASKPPPGLASGLLAQFSKLQQRSVGPLPAPRAASENSQSKGTTDISSSAQPIKIAGLEGIGWLSLLDELCGGGGGGTEAAEAEEAENRKPKYVPKEVKLLTAAAMGYAPGGDEKPRREKHVKVERRADIQQVRLALPVCAMEQEIVEAVNENDVIVLCGETGSGKSTQVPQFLYEYGYASDGLIGVTQPRRVAAVSTAMRVAEELGTRCGKGGFVAYQIRHDSRGVTPATNVKFMTDGVLLQEVGSDLLLRQYSVIILDEAHERNLNTDVLLGILSRAIPLRAEIAREESARYDALSEAEKAKATAPLKPLKLIIMSATLRVEDFTANPRLFTKPPPVLRAESRQFPVSIHFSRRTAMDSYLDEAFCKVCKIHKKLPPGGVLVFLTGKGEIQYMVRRLRKEFSRREQHKTGGRKAEVDGQGKDEGVHGEDGGEAEDAWDDGHVGLREIDDDEEDAMVQDGDRDDYDDAEAAESQPSDEDSDEDDAKAGNGDGEAGAARDEKGEDEGPGPVWVLPLYAMLTPSEQAKVFRPPPAGHRLIVVATNVAETSITIPNIKYVVDPGRVKARAYDHASGISQYTVQWVSQASADQRAGRAGRTGPGHCYRLFSSAVFSQRLEKFTAPEVLTLPLEDVVLQMKAMGVTTIKRFPFPTAPDPKALDAAHTLLYNLGAVKKDTGAITSLGRAMASLPVGVRSAKMLLLGRQSGVLDLVIAMVAAVSERDPLVFPDGRAQEKEEEDDEDGVPNDDVRLLREKAAALSLERYRQWKHPTSDSLVRLKVAGAYAFSAASTGMDLHGFCRENMLHQPSLARAHELRKQICRVLNRRFASDPSYHEQHVLPSMSPPTTEQEALLRQVVVAGHLDCIARLAPLGTVQSGSKIQRTCAYQACSPALPEPIYIHPHSSIFAPSPDRLPEYVCYQTIVRSAKGTPYMTCVTAVDPSWLPTLAVGSPLLSFGPPLASPPPTFEKVRDGVVRYCTPKYGAHGWELKAHGLLASEVGKDQGAKAQEEARDMGCRWFARLLLEGKVLEELTPLYKGSDGSCLNDPPALITHRRPVRKVLELVKPLVDRGGIMSVAALRAQWEQEPRFLKAAVKMWVRPEHQKLFHEVWTMMMKEAVSN